MFKLKKTKIHDIDWKIFHSTNTPTLRQGDIIRMQDSTGIYKVTGVIKTIMGSYDVNLEFIIPKTFPLVRLDFKLESGQKYRLIGKS